MAEILFKKTSNNGESECKNDENFFEILIPPTKNQDFFYSLSDTEGARDLFDE